MTLELIRVPSPSFACANFISTTATIGTNYKPNSHKTIGIYATVRIAQCTTQTSSIQSLETQSEPDAGTINTFGVRILEYLDNISVWWYVLGATSLAVAILAAAPNTRAASSSSEPSSTVPVSMGLDGPNGRALHTSPSSGFFWLSTHRQVGCMRRRRVSTF
jgi:hypothetical protein